MKRADATYTARVGNTEHRLRQTDNQRILERRRRFLGLWLPWREIDRETIPDWAVLQMILNGYSAWRSRLVERIARVMVGEDQ